MCVNECVHYVCVSARVCVCVCVRWMDGWIAVAVFLLLLCHTQSQGTFPLVEFFETPLLNNSVTAVSTWCLSTLSEL